MASSADVAMIRMRTYLNLPLVERCRELTILIEESITTELQHVFPVLIDSIFGVSNNVGWCLHSINLKRNPHEYEILSQFLGPQGPIFNLCYKLLPDCYLKYEFPVSYLPTKIKSMLEEGIIPPFYSDKFKDDQGSRLPCALSMNPFEYYVFHFAYHLTNPWLQIQYSDNVWMNWETVYVQLAHSYLYHFLPRDNSPVLPIIGPYIKKTPPRKLMQSPDSKRMQTPRLLRTSILTSVPSTSQGVPQQQCLPQVWRSETVVQVFLDFWLEYTEEDKLILQLNSPLNSSLPRRNSIHSGEHIRLVRAFVKTLHEFANSVRGDKSAMDELKRVILPSVQGKIYTFLRKAIYHWPLDSSFRLILEAWLSFIQPWRYISEIGIIRDQGKSDEEERGKIYDPSQWISFIANNLLAYTAIFQQLLPRFMRTDLVAPKNALMLFRVAKVFSQSHLTSIISEVENCMDDAILRRGKISSSQWSAIVRQQITELEGPTYQYVPLFSTTTYNQMTRLLSSIKQAHLTATSIIDALEKRRTEKRFLRSIWEFFNGEENSNDEIGLAERKRVPGFLASAQQQLIYIFQLEDIPEVAIVADKDYHDSILSTSFCHESYMDFSLNDSRPGVFMPIQNERHNYRYIEYMGDPELQPVYSNECAFLVRYFYHFCQLVNSKYENEMTRMYNSNGFIGSMTRRILRPPTTVIQLPKRTKTGFSPGSESRLPPRLSLRPLASYRFLALIFFGELVFYLMGYGVSLFFLFCLCCWMAYITISAVCEPWMPQTHTDRRRQTSMTFSPNLSM